MYVLLLENDLFSKCACDFPQVAWYVDSKLYRLSVFKTTLPIVYVNAELSGIVQIY